MNTYFIESPSNIATSNLNLKNLRHCLLIVHFLPIRPSSVLTENSCGMVEDHCATNPSIITEDLNNSAYALRELCPGATYKQIEQALSLVTCSTPYVIGLRACLIPMCNWIPNRRSKAGLF